MVYMCATCKRLFEQQPCDDEDYFMLLLIKYPYEELAEMSIHMLRGAQS